MRWAGIRFGAKTRQGDGRTPEGVYTIVRHNPASRFHLSLGISYPGPADVGNAILIGTEPGNAIMIHGIPNGQAVKPGENWGDWTDGCMAVSDREIEEIYSLGWSSSRTVRDHGIITP